jgi:hypothetical protein
MKWESPSEAEGVDKHSEGRPLRSTPSHVRRLEDDGEGRRARVTGGAGRKGGDDAGDESELHNTLRVKHSISLNNACVRARTLRAPVCVISTTRLPSESDENV